MHHWNASTLVDPTLATSSSSRRPWTGVWSVIRFSIFFCWAILSKRNTHKTVSVIDKGPRQCHEI